MRRSLSKLAVALVLALGATAVLADDKDELLLLHFELDPHSLKKEVDRVGKLLAAGSFEDGFALAEKLERDPRIREGLVEESPGRFVTLDRVLRDRMRSLEGAGQAAYDARHALDVARLAEQGSRRALERLLATAPGSSRTGAVTLRLAELDLEAGAIDLAAARLEDALATRGLAPALAERAAIELPGVYVLAGRRRDCADALARLDGDVETAARRVAAQAALASEGRRAEHALVTSALTTVSWVHENADFYEELRGGATPSSEPVCDATCVYLHDGSFCTALALDTGKLVWRTPLRDDGLYRATTGACRLVLSESVVVCAMPYENELVTLDRATGERLATIGANQLRAILGGTEPTTFRVEPLVSAGVLVALVSAEDAAQEFVALGFDPRTGALLWRTPVGHTLIDKSHTRARPLLAAGGGYVFVLPGWGVVAALDPETGGVAWLRRYAGFREHAALVDVHRQRRANQGANWPTAMRKGYLGLARGVLLVAPPDAPKLWGLDPRTGATLWETHDQSCDVIAGYGAGVIELDSLGELSFVARGREAKAVIPREALMHHRAALAGDVLLLPLGRGSVYRIDLARPGMDRNPAWSNVPGGPAHLAAVHGRVIAAGLGRVALLGEPAAAPAPPLDAASAGRALADPSYAVREAASQYLAGLELSAIGPVLSEAALSMDPERVLRARVLRDAFVAKERQARFAEIVAGSGDHTFNPARLVRKDHDARGKALEDLGKKSAYRPIYEEMVDDPDLQVAQKAALLALAFGGRSGVGLLAKMAQSPNPIDRRRAMVAFRVNGTADDWEVFARGLRDEDTVVRTDALDGALARGDGRMAAPLLKALDDGVELSKIHMIDLASVMHLHEGLGGPLLRRLVHDDDQKVRHGAVLALRNAKGPECRRALCEALGDPDPNVKNVALMVLREQVEREDPPELLPGAMETLLQDSERRFLDDLMIVARRLLEHGKPVKPAIFAKLALDDGTETQRIQLFLALRRSVELAPVDSRDVAAIASLTRSGRPLLRSRGYEALLRAHGPGRGPLLAEGLADADLEVRGMVERQLPACDTDVAFELMTREPLEESVARVLEKCDPRVLALAALRATEQPEPRSRSRGRERLRALRPLLETLVAAEKDASMAARLKAALAEARR